MGYQKKWRLEGQYTQGVAEIKVFQVGGLVEKNLWNLEKIK
jgi:hypothetical protein